MSLQHLINTSVSDAKGTLELRVERNPVSAGRSALDLFEALQGVEGQSSRRKMAAGILRKVAKAMEVGP